jgi:alcohol dehydrogenase class IV
MSPKDSIKDKTLESMMRDCRAGKEMTLARAEGGCGGAHLDVSAVHKLGHPLPKTEKAKVKAEAKKDPSVNA